MNETQLYERIMLPALYYRRPDELSDIMIADLIARATEQYERLTPDIARRVRADLFAAIDQPSHDTWDRIYRLPIRRPGVAESADLWTLVLTYTRYSTAEHTPGTLWEVVPSSVQIFLALAEYFGPTNEADPRELF